MNQRIGDARVSTDYQNLRRDVLRLAGVGSIYKEAVSGKTAVRQEFDHCLNAPGAGDTLVVWRLDRLERNLIRERTQAALVAARERGRSGGRKPKLDARQISEIKRLMSDPTIPVGQFAECYRASRTTIYKVTSRSAVPAIEPQSVASRKKSHRQDAA